MLYIEQSVGNTPLIKIRRLTKNANIFAKQEARNPAGSVKCRIAVAMLQSALDKKIIDNNTVIIEPTSGNTGIGLAFACAAMNRKLVLVMPESMSNERKKLLIHLGAKLVLTPAIKGMQGAIDKAYELNKEIKNSYIPDQFNNPVNPQTHRLTTAIEILQDIDVEVDFFVAGVGTGGTISGVGSVLKQESPNVKIIAVEPKDSPVISGGVAGSHGIQGIGAGFIPKNLNLDILDEVITVATDDAIHTSQKLAKQEGILCGISSGAAMWAALQISRRPANKGKVIVTVLPDYSERYISTALFS